MTNAEVLKYHFSWAVFVSKLPQYRHFIAASCISSAQKGHFFIFLLAI
jgi:hypothetical protein